jgi:hypothetical protein
MRRPSVPVNGNKAFDETHFVPDAGDGSAAPARIRLMAKQSSHILEMARKGAEHRYSEPEGSEGQTEAKENEMKPDLYTKAVLTVIAACLMWMSLGGPALLTPVHAQAGQQVIIAGWMESKGAFHPFENRGLPVVVEKDKDK